MNTPVVNDVFKFLAVRPAQRVTDHETRHTIIRDARAADPVSANKLVSLASDLAHPEAALARWREFDLSPLIPLVDSYREIVRRYEKLGAADAPPDAWEMLKETGVMKSLIDPRILGLAWDALYVADSTGADAGPRLEVPIAALRVLHFAKILNEQKRPTQAEALDALLATPALPLSFHEARVAPTVVPSAVGAKQQPTMVHPEISARSTELRALAQELVASERLLGLITNTPTAADPVMQTGCTVQQGGWYRSEFSLQTAPTLRSSLAGQLSHDEASLLTRLRVGEAAPVSIAAQTLQAHLSNLSRQASSLSKNEEFKTYMRDLTAPLAFPRPATIKADGTGAGAVAEPDPELVPDVDVSGRIIPLGIGDLKVVKQTLLAYVPGEVAHIENVLKGESKERKHRKLDRTETTVFTSEEETKETERDTQSTARFELKRETEQTIKEDMSVKAGLTVTASYGPVVATATGDFAYSTSKQDSQKSSSNFAQELVERSVSKVQTKTKTERTTKTLNEVEEINTHGIINTDPGAEHVICIYRWVDKRYRAQIYNYGVRLLLEFVVPEPAAFYRMAQSHRTPKVNATPPEPFENLAGTRLTIADIKESTYEIYISRYNASGVVPPPPATVYTGTTLLKDGLALGTSIAIGTKELVVPDGYTLLFYGAAVSIIWGGGPQFTLQVGNDLHTFQETPPGGTGKNMTSETQGAAIVSGGFSGVMPVSVAAYDVTAFTVNIQGICTVTPTAMEKWRVQTYDKIYAAYQALQTAYDQKVSQAEAAQGIAIQGQNPATNRMVEKTEIKKLCITMMTGQHFIQFNAMTDPSDKPKTYPEVDVFEALDEGRIEQFFEQAFEWEQMTYLFYPYFWGRKKNWVEVTNNTDPDPLFGQFLTAGAARVVVPVPIAYVDAVQFLLQSKGTDLGKKVWRGGERPTIDDDLYVSITEEMRNQTDDLAGATPEGEPWEFTLPTTLVWLQPDSTLPTFI